MKLQFRIDQLIVFLILSLSLLIIAEPAVIIGVKQSYQLRDVTSPEKSISYPDAGYYSKNDSLYSYNPAYQIRLSLDGGDSYQDYKDIIRIDQLENKNITGIPMSLHWKSPEGDLPELKSILIGTKDETKSLISESRVLTYYENRGSNLPVISLSIKNSDLFDELNGLMVYGQSSWYDSAFYKSWWYRSANFAMRGSEWERRVNFQYLEAGKLLFEQDCGIRISGNATRYFPQKSFRVYAREAYGNKRITYGFWEKDKSEITSLLLRNGGNDNTKTLFGDLFVQTLAAETNATVLKGKPVSLFINGNYWGIYFLQERIDAMTMALKSDSKEDEITILDAPNGTLKEGSDKEAEAFFQMVDDLEISDLSAKDYDRMDGQMNVKSFIDYIILETFIGNSDWPQNNCTWYKAEGEKWNWIIYDSDVSMAYEGEHNVTENHLRKFLDGSTVTSRLFRSLMEMDKFRRAFFSRADQLMETVLSEKNVMYVYNNTRNLIAADMQWQIKRWRIISSLEQWNKNCQANLDFLIHRRSIYKTQLEDLK